MSELVANADLEIEFEAVSVPPDAQYGGDLGIDGTKVIGIDSESECPKDKKIQKIIMTYVFTAATPCPFVSATYVFVAGGGVIPATGTILTSNTPICRQNDKGVCVGSYTLKATPFTPFPCSCKTKINEPGQDDVEAE